VRLYHKIEDWGDIVKWMKSRELHHGAEWTSGCEVVDNVTVYWIEINVRRHYNDAVLKWKL